MIHEPGDIEAVAAEMGADPREPLAAEQAAEFRRRLHDRHVARLAGKCAWTLSRPRAGHGAPALRLTGVCTCEHIASMDICAGCESDARSAFAGPGLSCPECFYGEPRHTCRALHIEVAPLSRAVV